jgi:hypothetical protein
MTISTHVRFRLGAFGLAAGFGVLLLGALPATAERTSAHHTTVVVTELKGTTTMFRFKLSRKTVPQGVVIFKVTNADSSGLWHNFTINSKFTRSLPKGNSATLWVNFATPGYYHYSSSLTGQAADGLQGTLHVT